LSVQGTNGILGRYLWVEFLSLFFETCIEDRKVDKLCGNVMFFQLVHGNKSCAQISAKQGRGSSQKKLQKFEFGFVMRKLWRISFWGHVEHLLEKK